MKNLCYLVIFVFLCACTEVKQEPKPANLIPLEKMIEITVDMNLVEAQIAEVQLLQNVVKDSVHAYYGQLFGKHNVTRDQYEESLGYYTTQIDLMDSIYTAAYNRLVKMDLELKDVELTDDVLTHVPAREMYQLLADTNLLPMLRSSKPYVMKQDSLLRYFRSNRHLLDTLGINYRQFGVSLNFYAGNQKKFEKVMAEVEKVAAE